MQPIPLCLFYILKLLLNCWLVLVLVLFESLGLSIYKIVSPANNDNYTFSFPSFLKFIFLRLWVGTEREGERERILGTVCALLPQNLIWGPVPWTMRSWPYPKSRVRCSTDWTTQALLSFPTVMPFISLPCLIALVRTPVLCWI